MKRDALDVKVISRVLTLPASGSLIALAIPGKVGTDIAPENLGQYKRTQSDMATIPVRIVVNNARVAILSLIPDLVLDRRTTAANDENESDNK